MKQDQLAFLLTCLTERKSLYIKGGDYDSVSNFVQGFFTSMQISLGDNISQEFHSFAQSNFNTDFSISVFDFIQLEMANEDSLKAENILINLLELYSVKNNEKRIR